MDIFIYIYIWNYIYIYKPVSLSLYIYNALCIRIKHRYVYVIYIYIYIRLSLHVYMIYIHIICRGAPRLGLLPGTRADRRLSMSLAWMWTGRRKRPDCHRRSEPNIHRLSTNACTQQDALAQRCRCGTSALSQDCSSLARIAGSQVPKPRSLSPTTIQNCVSRCAQNKFLDSHLKLHNNDPTTIGAPKTLFAVHAQVSYIYIYMYIYISAS